MAKFIEVTCKNGSKALVNINLIEEVVEIEDGKAKLLFPVYSCDSDGYALHNEMSILESYWEIKRMIQSDDLR